MEYRKIVRNNRIQKVGVFLNMYGRIATVIQVITVV